MNKHWPFNGKSTADDVLSGVDLSGQLIIVTGGNTGIGFETARALAAAGAVVVIACRSLQRGAAARRRIEQFHPDCTVHCKELDLASVASIRNFCAQLPYAQINTVICNAGAVNPRYEQTEDGFEQTVGVCHLGHFLLVKELIPRLLRAERPRVIMVSSESHRAPRELDFEMLPIDKAHYSAMKAYGQAKLCNALMARELDRRYGDRGLMACYLHPGTMVTTEIGRDSWPVKIAINLARPFTKSAAQGAATTVLCASWEDTTDLSGQYFSNCRPVRPSKEAVNAEAAQRLWETTDAWLEAV
ncbi:MAG: SDR family NAD(P)-dependent oxidoreductase [Halioglobus sp.]